MKKIPFLLSVGLLSNLLLAQVDPRLVNPVFEGVYIVNLECQLQDPTPKCSKIQRNLELVVLAHSKSVGVSIVDPQTMKARYVFDAVSVEKGGEEISGVNYSIPHPVGEITVSIDPNDNRIRGWLRDPEYQYDVKVYGRQLTSPSIFYAQEGSVPPLLIGALVGNYTGQVGGRAGILAIRASATGGMPLATFYDAFGTNRIDFTYTDLVSKQRTLNLLVEDPIKGTHLKWTIGISIGPDGLPILKGLAFSSYGGSYYGLQFNRQ